MLHVLPLFQIHILANSSSPNNSSAKLQNYELLKTGFLQQKLSDNLKTKLGHDAKIDIEPQTQIKITQLIQLNV